MPKNYVNQFSNDFQTLHGPSKRLWYNEVVKDGRGFMSENEYAALREKMVEFQLKNRGIKDEKVLDAFSKVKRHAFVSGRNKHMAYNDHPLPIGDNQTISQPYIVALMTEALSPDETMRVLEIGTGSGYQTAILAEICREVYTVEKIERLQEKAKAVLDDLGYRNITYKIGDGKEGFASHAPYEGILVTAATKKPPEALIDQLKEGGKLVVPVGGHFAQDLMVYTKKGDTIKGKSLGGCRFVPLT